MKKSGNGLSRIVNACGWSLAGLKSTLRHEAAFRQEAILFCVLAPLGFWLGATSIERVLLVGVLVLVLIIEVLNSAIEAVVDRFGQEYHSLSKRAKDMGSAAVFLALLNVLFTWLTILLPRYA